MYSERIESRTTETSEKQRNMITLNVKLAWKINNDKFLENTVQVLNLVTSLNKLIRQILKLPALLIDVHYRECR